VCDVYFFGFQPIEMNKTYNNNKKPYTKKNERERARSIIYMIGPSSIEPVDIFSLLIPSLGIRT
jgi:hypothetical protein